MSRAQVEAHVLEVLRAHAGSIRAGQLSTELEQRTVTPAERREALLALALEQRVQITPDLLVRLNEEAD